MEDREAELLDNIKQLQELASSNNKDRLLRAAVREYESFEDYAKECAFLNDSIDLEYK